MERLKRKIVSYLSQSKEKTAQQLATHLHHGIPKIKRALNELIDEGLLVREGTGVKGDPIIYSQMDKGYSADFSDDSEEPVADVGWV